MMKQISRSERTAGANRGYSIVEMMIAMALLATVLVAVMTLFFFGRGNVYSGKQMTLATSVGTHVMEDTMSMTADDIYTAFNVTSASTLGNYTLFGTTYNNCLIRSTDANIIASPPADIASERDPDGAGPATGPLTTWRNEMVNNNKLANGVVTLILTPTIPGTPVLDANGLANLKVLKVRAIVSWTEPSGRIKETGIGNQGASGRTRFVILDSSKRKR